MSDNDKTLIRVDKETATQLREMKPFPSMSYDDLIRDMAEKYGGGSD